MQTILPDAIRFLKCKKKSDNHTDEDLFKAIRNGEEGGAITEEELLEFFDAAYAQEEARQEEAEGATPEESAPVEGADEESAKDGDQSAKPEDEKKPKAEKEK